LTFKPFLCTLTNIVYSIILKSLRVVLEKSIFALLKNLIDRPSATGKEIDVSDWLSLYLEKAGFTVHRQPVSGGRYNIFARMGEPVLVFTSHLDTVPGEIPFSEDSRYIYGRGACDAKGCVAAQVKAGEGLVSEGIGPVGFLFLAGEEHGSDGARAANGIPNSCRFLIGGEPTDNKLAFASKGALRYIFRAEGRTAHSAYPETGDSAVLKLLDFLNAVRAETYPADPVLGETTVNIGVLSGGTRANVVPDRAEAEVIFRTVSPSSGMKDRITRLSRNGVSASVAFECDPFFYGQAPGFETSVVSYTTDLPLLDRWGKAFLIGPGSILDAHGPDEKILKTSLAEGVDQYRRLAAWLMKSTGGSVPE
jgi:acetylornithine deacetylase